MRMIARTASRLAMAACVAALVGCVPTQTGGGSTPTSSTSTTTLTAPPGTVGFAAFGDAGTGDAVQHQVADAIERWAAAGHAIDALVEAGDDVYPDGDPSRFAATLDEPYRDLRATRPLWVALGNHDVMNGHGPEQLRYLGLPDLPYEQTLPNVQLLFLDANHPDQSQAEWLDARLSEPGPSFRVVVFHHPAYSCGPHNGTAAVVQWWVPVLEAHAVALVISGHDHYYERFLSANGVTYVVTGGGGAAIYTRDPGCTGTPPSQATAARHHFFSVEILGATMTVTAVARTGEVLDQAVITR